MHAQGKINRMELLIENWLEVFSDGLNKSFIAMNGFSVLF